MGEDHNKSDEERFEDGLRQILDGGPSGGQKSAGRQPGQPEEGRPENKYLERKAAGGAEAEPKALFWFRLMRPLAFAALLLMLVKFVQRIINAQ